MVYINSKKSHIKPLKDLNLINSFLFDVSMEDPNNAATIARIIVKRATGRDIDRIKVETQKELKGYDTENRGVQLDVIVYSEDSHENITEVYDIEPNDYTEKDLAKRTRYYNSMIDVKLLKTQEAFGKLPELFSIWILSYDPFGDDRMVYTVKNMVAENPLLVYNDGVTNLFLFTGGTVGGSKDLHNLLTLMTDTTDANAVDSDLEKIQSIVNSVKDDRKVGERYMSLEKIIKSTQQQFFDDGHKAGFDEGHNAGFDEGHNVGFDKGHNVGFDKGHNAGFDEGRNEVIHSFIESYIEDGFSPEVIKGKLISKCNLSESDADLYLSEYFK